MNHTAGRRNYLDAVKILRAVGIIDAQITTSHVMVKPRADGKFRHDLNSLSGGHLLERDAHILKLEFSVVW